MLTNQRKNQKNLLKNNEIKSEAVKVIKKKKMGGT